MTPELKKTLAFLGVAAVLAGSSWFLTRPRVTSAEAFRDLGEPFFPGFTDPLAAKSLEVVDFDAGTGDAIPFKVAFEPGKGWVIPSHHDYPADAKDRLAKTAAGVIDLKKDVIASDSANQHEELGVIDPLAPPTASLSGRGKRVALRDGSGKALAELILGKPVPGRSGMRFARVPEQPRTYGVAVDVDLSARFADWIETNLLKLDAFRVTRVTIDNHKVDPEAGTITPGDVVDFRRADPSSPWTMEEVPAGQELDTAKISALTNALADLKIVGVRPKPPGLTAELKAAAADGQGLALSRASQLSLQAAGFYVLKDGRLLSNQGDIYVRTDEGIIYVLRFGEVTLARGEALTAGTPDDAAKKDEGKKDEATKDAGAGDNRYLFVTAEFDERAIRKPEALAKAEVPPDPDGLPEKPFARTPEEAKADDEKAKREKEDFDRKVADGKKKAQELTDRFAGWYYVVPGDAYRTIVTNQAGLLKPKAAPGAGAAGEGAGPGGFGPPAGMLPPGLNLGPRP
jgi:hypothetical protein